MRRSVGMLDSFCYICNRYQLKTPRPMKKTSFLYRAYDLYVDGFRHMTLGKTLWTIIIIKLFVIFVVLKIFFFPNFIKQHAAKGEEPEFVATQILK